MDKKVKAGMMTPGMVLIAIGSNVLVADHTNPAGYILTGMGIIIIIVKYVLEE